MSVIQLRDPDEIIARRCLDHLQRAVAIDSQSDESSEAIPSSPGQSILADAVAATLGSLGARVERDGHANVIATIDGRGCPPAARPLALMVHLDTSRGTRAIDTLDVRETWDGKPIPYRARPDLQVSVEEYPETAQFLGHDLVHGPGDAPFGLDDKLGLSQMLTLVELLAAQPEIGHPPIVLVARPDEEIGRMAAVEGLAELLASRGVSDGFTLDGLLPFEINVENFNASVASILFRDRPLDRLPGPAGRRLARLWLGGVNTHGATARAEGYRAATRFAAELLAQIEAASLSPSCVVPVRFASDEVRDCDGVLDLLIGGPDAERACHAWGTLSALAARTIDPHVPRGASWTLSDPLPTDPDAGSGAASDMLRFVRRLLEDEPGFVIPAEDSAGRDGYSAPYRARPADGGIRLDVRLRDFDPAILREREQHVRKLAEEFEGAEVRLTQQYVNMGPQMSGREHLVEWPRLAGRLSGCDARVEPIRGGTGVDPFLDRGVFIANLGTGYFAPESEKEFTSLQMMAGHVRWLATLVQIAAGARG